MWLATFLTKQKCWKIRHIVQKCCSYYHNYVMEIPKSSMFWLKLRTCIFSKFTFLASLVVDDLIVFFLNVMGAFFWFVLGWDKGCSGFTEDKYHNSWSCGSIDKRRHPNCEWLVCLFYFFVCKREHDRSRPLSLELEICTIMI